jgi:threonine dehydratase
MNKLKMLSSAKKRAGVVAASTGNHGQALCYASQIENIALTLYLPKTASPLKIARIKNYGVSPFLYGTDCEKTEIHARRIAERSGRTYISGYNDYDIVCGQGSLGMEILEDIPDVQDVLVPVGGGGLISGIAGYIRNVNPGVRVFGVEPENSRFMAASIIAGRLVRLREKKTIADAVAGGIEPGSITFPLCQKYVDEFLTVTESQIKKSIAALHREHGQVVEGAGALPLAALFKDSDAFRGRKVVLVASGGNIAQDLFRKIAGKSRARKP